MSRRRAASRGVIPAVMTSLIVWLNGALMPQSAAGLDPLSHAVLMGVGVYDSVLVREGRPVLLERHLQRLANGAARLCLPLPDPATLTEAIASLIAAHGLGDCRLRITVGAGPSASVQPAPDGNFTLITLAPLSPVKPGAALTVTPFRRNEHSPLAGIKFTACAENVLAQRAALAAGFDEALFLNTAGAVCEAAFSNIFLVSSGRVLTSSLASGCLPGVTREVVLELCASHGISAEEAILTEAALHEADECFVTSSIRGIQPVHRLDDRVFDAPGKVTAVLKSLL